MGICSGLSGLYWLSTYALEFLQAYRRGGWIAVEQAIDKNRHSQPLQSVRGNDQN